MQTSEAIERLLYGTMPLARAMGVRVAVNEPPVLVLEAPLERNHNHLGTAFGGSIASLAMLTGYALLFAELGDPRAHVVLKECNIRYLRPVRGNLRARATLPQGAPLDEFKTLFQRKSRGRLTLKVELEDGVSGETAAVFEGEFVAIR